MNFKDFTNLYELSKTLQFELKPIGKTLENLKKNNLLIKDKERAQAYDNIKPIFGDLHADFIKESLSSRSLSWVEYFETYKKYRNEQNKEIKYSIWKEKEKIEKDLRVKITEFFLETAEKWKKKYKNKKGKPILRDKGHKILTEVGILEVLKTIHKNSPEKKEAINKFVGFFTYFSGFNRNRENYYSSEDKATSVSNRIINENLPIFCSNIIQFEKYLKDIHSFGGSLIFNISFYNNCLAQEGIDRYNKEAGQINKEINLFNQKDQQKRKLPRLKTLHKQVGGAIEKESPFLEINDEKYPLAKVLREFIDQSTEKNKKIIELVSSLSVGQDFTQIYLSKNAINKISNRWFSNWHVLSDTLTEKKVFKELHDGIKVPDFVKISDIKDSFADITDSPEVIFKEEFGTLFENKSNFEIFLSILKEEFKRLYDEFDVRKKQLENIISLIDNKNEGHKEIIKNFSDSALHLFQMAKYFVVKESRVEGTDSDFYEKLKNIFEDYKCSTWYDAIRNYLTKKPFDESKIKLNFDCSTLCAGWDLNKETQNLATILKDEEGLLYLAISNREHNFSFDKERNKKLFDASRTEKGWQKMEYKLLPGPNKMLPKVFFTNKNNKNNNPDGYFEIPKEILEIRERESFKKGDAFSRKDLNKWIDFCKENIVKFPSWKVFNFHFLPSEKYEDVSKFYYDVEKQGYKLDFVPIDKNILYKMVDAGEIYLFNIKNKDSNKKSTGRKNLHTLYWDLLFSNKTNIVKLNGEAEIFFRPASIEKKSETRTKKSNSHKITPNNRYTEDKFLFHVPIKLNFCEKNTKINDGIRNMIRDNRENLHIIGIDRGEKHLAYYSVIDTHGNIIEQGTLNKDLLGKDYAQKLEETARSRDEARKSWQTIGKIKDLKDGYMSQVIKRIADLIIKYNGVVALEDLNVGFKRGRQKIEKSVYQKLELALAKKLNYLVLKNANDNDAGSALKAYQLTPPTQNFGDIKGKQWGIMLYVRAAYTSITDPVTGFRKNIYLKRGSNDTMRKTIMTFREIGFDNKKNAFFLKYNPADFEGNKSISREWTIWSCVDRFYVEKDRNSQKWIVKEKNVTDSLIKIFRDAKIDFHKSILDQVAANKELPNKFYEELIWNINLILQLRNCDSGKGLDFIQSPVEPFFDSREFEKLGQDEKGIDRANMPVSGDANGAYNIARKGLLMVDRLKEKTEKPELYISDEAWDCFVTM